MPPITPMPSAAAPRQTGPDDHTDCAARITAQFAQGVAPEKELRDGMGQKKPPADTPRWNQDDYHKEFAGTLKEQIAAGVAP